MDNLSLMFMAISLVAGMFLAWLYTKPGKKWLENL